MAEPVVGVVMGSDSDWETMQHAARRLEELGVPFETRVVSAHRTPDLLFRYAEEAAGRGLRCIIAGAGGAAHLPGMLAAKTSLPIFGVPIPTKHLQGLDSLLSIVQMPAGVPVATFAIGAPARRTPRSAPQRCSRSAIRSWPSGWRSCGGSRPGESSIFSCRGSACDPARRHAGGAGWRAARQDVRSAGPDHGLPSDGARPRPPSPAGQMADVHLRAAYSDPNALDQLAAACAAVTTEFENVPAEALERLERSCRVRPPVKAVAVAQDRISEKGFLERAGFRTAPFDRCGTRRSCEPPSRGEAPRPAQDQPTGIRRQGPGAIERPGEAAAAYAAVGRVECVLEERLALESELSVVLARGDDGAIATFPVGREPASRRHPRDHRGARPGLPRARRTRRQRPGPSPARWNTWECSGWRCS